MISQTYLQTAPTFHSRAVKKTKREDAQKLHFEESAKFRNPIVGIEASLDEKLKENELLFRGSSVKKKNLLIDALEDLSLTNFGFADQFKHVVSYWRKPSSENMELKLRISTHDIDESQKQLDEMKNKNQELDETISNLLDEIQKVDSEINEIKQKTEEAKKKILLNSNRFAQIRITQDTIADIQKKYDQMFITPFRPKIFPENKEMADENEEQKKILLRLNQEVRISNQITNHLKSLMKDQK